MEDAILKSAEAVEACATAGRESVADRVAADILEMMASGDISAGDRLPSERRLAEELSVSRVSVRAALQRLKAQGFLIAVQGGGTRVVKTAGDADPALAELVRIDRTNLLDLMDLRAEMEVWAAGKAAVSATKEDLALLNRALAEMRTDNAPRPQDKARADVAFHMAVARASHSVVYRHLLSVVRETLSEMLHYHRTELFGTPADDRMVMHQHGAIIDAIASADPERAKAAMRAHMNWTRDHYDKKRQQIDTLPLK